MFSNFLYSTNVTLMSVLLLLRQKRVLAALRAAPWWVMLTMCRVPY